MQHKDKAHRSLWKHRERKNDLTEKLSKHYNWLPLYESVDRILTCAILSGHDKVGFSLAGLLFDSAFRQVNEIRGMKRQPSRSTIYEDAYIFAAHLHHSGNISDRVLSKLSRYLPFDDKLC
jgi:deoxyadenosine/deoxycytidine kinase